MCSDDGFGIVFGFIFLAPSGFIFPFADALRLKQMKRERKADVKAFPAEPAPDWKL